MSQNYVTQFGYFEEKPFYSILNSTEGYYSFKTVNDALEIKRLLNDKLIKNHLLTEEKRMMELGLLISEILPKYLTRYSYNNDANKIFDILEVPNLMSTYDQAYSNYSKYFNSLSQSEREMIGTHILDNSKYVEKFFIEEEYPLIITPEALQITINEKVREEIIKNHKSIIEDDNRLAKLSHATQMMGVEEIADLYGSVRLNIEYMINEYASTEESLLEYKDEILQYQWLFAEVIRQRITSNDKNINASLTEEQIRLKENEEIVKICMGIFQEKPLDPNLSKYVNSDNEEVLKKQGEDMLAIYKSTQESSNTTMNSSNRTIKKKVFSVDRLKRTISNLFGDSKSMESIQDNPSIDQTSSGKIK